MGLYKAYLLNNSKTGENLYKKYKNELNHVIKASKKIYYEEQLIKYKHYIKAAVPPAAHLFCA
jgi:hypothetical protein